MCVTRTALSISVNDRSGACLRDSSNEVMRFLIEAILNS